MIRHSAAALNVTIIISILTAASVYLRAQDMYFMDDNIDTRLFRAIYDDSSAFKTSLALHFDNSALPVYILMPIATFAYGRAFDKPYEENTGFLLGISEITNMALTAGIKYIVKRERPYHPGMKIIKTHSPPYRQTIFIRQKDLSTHDPYSFPSGHASSSFNIATIIALRYPGYPESYIPMYLWAIAVSWGRPYLGMHYPSDVLAGAVIGAGSSVIAYSLRKELLHFKNKLFKEDKTDAGSINGGIAAIFAGAFIISDLFDTYILENNKLNFSLSGSSPGNTRIDFKWNF